MITFDCDKGWPEWRVALAKLEDWIMHPASPTLLRTAREQEAVPYGPPLPPGRARAGSYPPGSTTPVPSDRVYRSPYAAVPGPVEERGEDDDPQHIMES